MGLTEPTTAFIALGANLGDRATTIHTAVIKIAALPGTQVVRFSSLLENPAVGGPVNSPSFLNAIAQISTILSPKELLNSLLTIEAQLGRLRLTVPHQGEPRIIDLDLLLYGDEKIDDPGLTLPHPRMHERRFVLAPLAEIAPNLVHPVLGKSIRALLDELTPTP